jgi:hypothetical protein
VLSPFNDNIDDDLLKDPFDYLLSILLHVPLNCFPPLTNLPILQKGKLPLVNKLCCKLCTTISYFQINEQAIVHKTSIGVEGRYWKKALEFKYVSLRKRVNA